MNSRLLGFALAAAFACPAIAQQAQSPELSRAISCIETMATGYAKTTQEPVELLADLAFDDCAPEWRRAMAPLIVEQDRVYGSASGWKYSLYMWEALRPRILSAGIRARAKQALLTHDSTFPTKDRRTEF